MEPARIFAIVICLAAAAVAIGKRLARERVEFVCKPIPIDTLIRNRSDK